MYMQKKPHLIRLYKSMAQVLVKHLFYKKIRSLTHKAFEIVCGCFTCDVMYQLSHEYAYSKLKRMRLNVLT